MIPFRIHCCWLSGEPKPKLAQRCLASWRKFAPQCEIKEWTDDRCRAELGPVPDFYEGALKAHKWAFASDWVRFAAVAKEGGIYLDLDVELIAPLEPLLRREDVFFALAQDEPPLIDPGLGFAACAHHPAIIALAQRYNSLTFDPACHLAQTCPEIAMSTLTAFPHLTRLPAHWFNPKGGCAGEIKLTPETIAIHHFAASWFNWKQRFAYLWLPRIKKWFRK